MLLLNSIYALCYPKNEFFALNVSFDCNLAPLLPNVVKSEAQRRSSLQKQKQTITLQSPPVQTLQGYCPKLIPSESVR